MSAVGIGAPRTPTWRRAAAGADFAGRPRRELTQEARATWSAGTPSSRRPRAYRSYRRCIKDAVPRVGISSTRRSPWPTPLAETPIAVHGATTVLSVDHLLSGG